jgi:sialic acid synthase SpsE
MGACIIEKHLTISRQLKGPDSAFSLEPNEFREMVEAVRVAHKAMGVAKLQANESEARSRVFRRSLFVVNDVKKGEAFTVETVRSIRPAHGLHPRHLPEIVGRLAACDIAKGTPLSWDLVVGGRR